VVELGRSARETTTGREPRRFGHARTANRGRRREYLGVREERQLLKKKVLARLASCELFRSAGGSDTPNCSRGGKKRVPSQEGPPVFLVESKLMERDDGRRSEKKRRGSRPARDEGGAFRSDGWEYDT